MTEKVKNLVVDTSAFIKSTPLQEHGINIYTVQEVLAEIKCKRQLKRVAEVPSDIMVKDVNPISLAFVRNFAKKTGDYSYLSSTDLKLIALTYELEKELVGCNHLRTEPIVKKILEMEVNTEFKSVTPGFYSPQKSKTEIVRKIEAEDDDSHLQEVPDVDAEVISQQFSLLSCNGLKSNGTDDINSVEEEEEEEDNDDEEDDVEFDIDDEGWITPSNLKKKQSAVSIGDADEDIVSPTVACLTTDFSMQNVLKQIGLNIVSLDGMIITEERKFVLRCFACFHIVPQTTRLFCPKCGNKTLKRVSIVIDPEGNQHVIVNFRRPISARGKKFPIPRPRGGKHAINPILCEDQRVPQQRLSKLALIKNNPMNPDYVAGVSPFIMRDVNSRSAVLNVANKSEVKYWMRKNPNEVIKKRRKK